MVCYGISGVVNCAYREMPKWQVNRKLFRQKKSANGFILSNHENEMSQLINMTKDCEKSQVAKIRQTYDFSQFSQILLNRQLALDFSGY